MFGKPKIEPILTKKSDENRIASAVSGVRAVESMSVEIESLRRQDASLKTTMNSLRAEHQAAIESCMRLQKERDFYMSTVAELRVHIETIKTQAFSALEKTMEVEIPSDDTPSELAEKFAPQRSEYIMPAKKGGKK